MPLTFEQIHATAEALTGRGITPTLAAVRRELGGGSFTTISEAMQSWRAGRQAATLRETLPPEAIRQQVTEQVWTLAQAVWTAAVNHAREVVASEREELAAVQAALAAERQEAAARAEQGEQDREVLRAAGEQERQHRVALEQSINTLRSEVAVLRERCDQQARQLSEAQQARQAADIAVETARQQVRELTDALRAAEHDHVVAQAEARLQSERASRLEAERTQTQAELTALNQSLVRAQAEHRQRDGELAVLQTQIARLETRADAAEQARHQSERFAEQVQRLLERRENPPTPAPSSDVAPVEAPAPARRNRRKQDSGKESGPAA